MRTILESLSLYIRKGHVFRPHSYVISVCEIAQKMCEIAQKNRAEQDKNLNDSEDNKNSFIVPHTLLLINKEVAYE